MTCSIPAAAEVRGRLMQLSRRSVIDLASRTGVPFPTLVKIRNGQTMNPGVETVRQFWPALIGDAAVPGAGAIPTAANDSQGRA